MTARGKANAEADDLVFAALARAGEADAAGHFKDALIDLEAMVDATDGLVARMRVRPVGHPTPQCLACGAVWYEAHAVTLPDCPVAILAARAEKVRRS